MGNSIIITRVQQVEVPVSDDFKLKDFCNVLNEGDLFDDDRIYWDKENVVEEDYSFAVHDSKVNIGDKIYSFDSPYDIGTSYSEIEPRQFSINKEY